MKKSVMKKWVKALRSGKYKQGKAFLKNDGRYCCLGVLCEISGVARTSKSGSLTLFGGALTALPGSVTDYAGMKSNTGEYKDTDLSQQNDRGITFKTIADRIEKNWEKL